MVGGTLHDRNESSVVVRKLELNSLFWDDIVRSIYGIQRASEIHRLELDGMSLADQRDMNDEYIVARILQAGYETDG